MDPGRLLRGGCHCGRNRYFVQFPNGTNVRDAASVLFSCNTSHRIAQASPLAAFVRVPLEWYHSTTFAFFPDETNAMIRRAYSSPHEQHTLRHFCGYCGTPLTFWSEDPRTEADYIQLTLGSLSSDDLGDLQDLGLLPDLDSLPGSPSDTGMTEETEAETEGAEEAVTATTTTTTTTTTTNTTTGREIVGGLPWFDSLVEGSRLGTIRSTRGGGRSPGGRVRIEWEVVEYTEGEDEDDGNDTPQSGKRKLDDLDDDGEERPEGSMEGVQQ